MSTKINSSFINLKRIHVIKVVKQELNDDYTNIIIIVYSHLLAVMIYAFRE